MRAVWERLKSVYLRLVDPTAAVLARWGVSPNTITIIGTAWAALAGVLFALGHIRTAGWVLGLTAIFDVLDGMVARRSGKTSVFGAFFDSTLDRIADGALMGGLTVFYAINPTYRSMPMMVVALVGLVGTFVISYTRARAEALGIDAKMGIMQRPERIVLLAVPQALFGLALGGAVLTVIVFLVTLTAWMTAIERIRYVYRVTSGQGDIPSLRVVGETPAPTARLRSRRAQP